MPLLVLLALLSGLCLFLVNMVFVLKQDKSDLRSDTPLESTSSLLHTKKPLDSTSLRTAKFQQKPFVNDFLRRLNYRGAVEASRGGSRVHDLFNPDTEAILFDKRTHPTHTVVIDVGAFDGLDIAYPAYENGYTVVAFELAPTTQNNIVGNWERKGLERDVHFRIIEVGELVDKIPTEPGATMFLPLGKDGTIRMYLVRAGASDQNKRISVTGTGTTAQVNLNNGKGNEFLIEIDRLVKPDVNVFLLKTDAEGHDGKALYGARKLLENKRVYTTTLEFRPKSLREHGTDPVELLQWLWDLGVRCYDMNSHPGYEPQGIRREQGGLGRGSYIADFVAWLDAVPRTKGPKGDALGGWEDLLCTTELN
jgi:FkbM family methyltransferase